MMRITEPGIYTMDAADYHGDPCPTPSLSASVAKILSKASPLHARHAHPRLNPNFQHDDGDDTSAAGTIIHKLILGKGADIVEVDAPDWRTNAAKAARDAARADGKTPVLRHKMLALNACAMAARNQIAEHPDCRHLLEQPGAAEQVIAWKEGEIWCRSMIDWLPEKPNLPVLDLKFTNLLAAPDEWQRRIIHEYAIQASFYERGLSATRGAGVPPLLFVVVEMQPPYALQTMACSTPLRALNEDKVARAIGLWQRCMAAGKWPGYAPMTAFIDAPEWLLREAEYQAQENGQ